MLRTRECRLGLEGGIVYRNRGAHRTKSTDSIRVAKPRDEEGDAKRLRPGTKMRTRRSTIGEDRSAKKFQLGIIRGRASGVTSGPERDLKSTRKWVIETCSPTETRALPARRLRLALPDDRTRRRKARGGVAKDSHRQAHVDDRKRGAKKSKRRERPRKGRCRASTLAKTSFGGGMLWMTT